MKCLENEGNQDKTVPETAHAGRKSVAMNCQRGRKMA
jgi:hypothetical protein